MNLLRIWPGRFCPACGGRVVRFNNLLEREPRLQLLAGAGELPAWLGLGVGAIAVAVLGMSAGVAIGVVVAVGLLVVLVAAAVRLERRSLLCQCEACSRTFPFAHTLRKPGTSSNA